MQRWLIGIIGIVLIVVGLALYAAGPENLFGLSSAMLRAGPVLLILALALPQVKRLFQYAPPWYLAVVGVSLLIVIRWPKTFLVLLPILVALWFLSPRRPAAQAARAKTKPKPRPQKRERSQRQ
jgi:hypothetical protein